MKQRIVEAIFQSVPTMVFIILGLVMAQFLSGCQALKTPFDSGYRVGDTTRSILEIQRDYCTTTDAVERAALLTVIRIYAPSYPLTGACTDPLKIYDYVTPEVTLPDEIVTPDEVGNDITRSES